VLLGQENYCYRECAWFTGVDKRCIQNSLPNWWIQKLVKNGQEDILKYVLMIADNTWPNLVLLVLNIKSLLSGSNSRSLWNNICKYCINFAESYLTGQFLNRDLNGLWTYRYTLHLNALVLCIPSIHQMTLQPKLGPDLLCWGSITIIFYGMRLLASRSTPVNFGGPMILCWGLLP
jgi:hypothetical protein